jgi:hypothetical protein
MNIIKAIKILYINKIQKVYFEIYIFDVYLHF